MVSHNSAKIWLNSKGDKTVYVQYEKEGRKIQMKSELIQLNKNNSWTYIFHLKDLEPNSRYNFKIISSIPMSESFQGKFKTFPQSNGPVDLNFNYGSCIEPTLWANLNFLQYWLDQKLDFALLLGDTIYTDLFGDISHSQAYSQLMSDPHFTEFLRNIPNFWMYDDHEIVNDYDKGETDSYYRLSVNWWRYYFGNITQNLRYPMVIIFNMNMGTLDSLY